VKWHGNSSSVCLSVSNTVRFVSPDAESSFSHCGYILEGYDQFTCEDHLVKVKVTGAKAQKNLFLQCKTSTSNNSGSRADRDVKFACSVRFLATADQMA